MPPFRLDRDLGSNRQQRLDRDANHLQLRMKSFLTNPPRNAWPVLLPKATFFDQQPQAPLHLLNFTLNSPVTRALITTRHGLV
jgi:hypothetical protein